MTKKLLLFTTLALFATLSVLAGPRTFTQAQKIAEAKANSLGIVIDAKAKAKAKVLNGADGQMQTIASYYVFPNGTNKGFTIVSGDDRMPEIVGYTDKGTYDETQMPDAMKAFLESYKAMVEAVKAGDKQAIKALNECKTLRSNPNRTAAAVSPLLGDIQYNQDFPYNYLCPLYNGSNKAATGCVATAMAQVMAYWKYPSKLLADIPAYTTATLKINMDAISAGETYDWDNILATYPSDGYPSQYNTTQALAVAKLMLHCGTAINMDYNSTSGASVTTEDMAKFFGYDADLMVEVHRSMVSVAKWTELIDNELKAKRPILYYGFSSDVGHEFVCDGSDGEGLYHINWGWGGAQDGYFDITVLNPAKGGIGSGNASDGFNRSCGMIIGIQPDNGVTDEPLIVSQTDLVVQKYDTEAFTSGMEITKNTRIGESGSFKINIKDAIFSYASGTATGELAYGISDGNGGYTILTTPEKYHLKRGYGIPLEVTFNFSPKAGTYTIYALYRKDGETTWNKCLYNDIYPYTFTATETELTQTASENLTAELAVKGALEAYSETTLSMTITNNGDDDFIGDINVYWRETNECPETVAQNVYITVAAHSSTTRDVTLNTIYMEGGDKIYVWVKDASGNYLISAAEFTVVKTTNPVLTLVSVENNATPGDYETENAKYGGQLVKAPKVNDDYAFVRYGFKNLGASGNVRYYISATNIDTYKQYWKGFKTVYVPADGTITYIEETYTPQNIGGSRFMACQPTVYFEDSDNSALNFIDMENPNYYLLLVSDETRGYRISANMQFLYVAGKPTAIDNPAVTSGLTITGADGEIVVSSDKKENLSIYSVDGRQVAQVTVDAGATKSVSVPAGIYVVKGKKIVVR